MLAETSEPLIPKLEMLTQWRPQIATEQVVKLAATSVLSEKIAKRAWTQTRIVAWISAGALIVAAVAAFFLGRWTA
jgi:hypothetical protein